MSKKAKAQAQYLVLKSIWSRQHGCYFEPGDVVSFTEGDNAPDIDRLIAGGVLQVLTEADDGENGADSPISSD